MNNEIEDGLNLKDGEYTVTVELEGGSGRAQVKSPAEAIVKDGQFCARIEWSSSHYDYMIVDGEQYLPVNKEGNSAFDIPVPVFDEPIEVIADTTAMSKPYEVEYTLTFDSNSIEPAEAKVPGITVGIALAAVLILVVFGAAHIVKKKRRNSE